MKVMLLFVFGAAGCAMLEAAAFIMLGQAATSPAFDEWAKDLLTAWGPIGVLAWYLYYTTSFTFPRISQQHLDQLTKLDQEHRAELHAAMQDWRRELREDRATFTIALEKISNGLSAIRDGSHKN